ncbi:MAG: hypothetical protein H0U73_13605 [Tatlockia sp.]|nr:hypothetical protein [Tatlockia sp.]
MSNETKTLSKSANLVQKWLEEKGLPFNVIELAASTRTAQDAANTIGCGLGQIVKSLLFRTQKTNRPILVCRCRLMFCFQLNQFATLFIAIKSI